MYAMLHSVACSELALFLNMLPVHITCCRLCYELHLQSGCPLGEPPITCAADICLGRRCLDFPNAVCRVYGCGDTCEARWYDGNTGQWVKCDREYFTLSYLSFVTAIGYTSGIITGTLPRLMFLYHWPNCDNVSICGQPLVSKLL